MRKLLKLAAAAALTLPLAAFAAGTIGGSRHNLSTSGPNAAARSATESQICVFCHTPHNAVATKLLWNRATNTAGGWLTGNTTSAGTSLPTAALIQMPSRYCLSCHDGSIALGAVTNYNGTAVTISVTGSDTTGGMLSNARYLVGGGAGNDMNKNHPVSLPYAKNTYNGVVSSVPTADTAWRAVQVGTCSTGSPACTTGGTAVRLYTTTGQTASTTNQGMECGSCHDPHDNVYGNFLQANNAGSALCQGCHNK